MIENITLEKIKNRAYFATKASNTGIYHLGSFLTDDVGCSSIDSWKEWINNPLNKGIGSNYSYVEKIDDKIRIWFQYDRFEETPGAEYFETTVDELNIILDLWKEVIEKLPAKVIITRNNGKVTFTYCD